MLFSRVINVVAFVEWFAVWLFHSTNMPVVVDVVVGIAKRCNDNELEISMPGRNDPIT